MRLSCWDWTFKSKTWYNKVRHNCPFVILLVYWYWFEHLTHVSYFIYDLSALGVEHNIQVIGSL